MIHVVRSVRHSRCRCSALPGGCNRWWRRRREDRALSASCWWAQRGGLVDSLSHTERVEDWTTLGLHRHQHSRALSGARARNIACVAASGHAAGVGHEVREGDKLAVRQAVRRHRLRIRPADQQRWCNEEHPHHAGAGPPHLLPVLLSLSGSLPSLRGASKHERELLALQAAERLSGAAVCCGEPRPSPRRRIPQNERT